MILFLGARIGQKIITICKNIGV